MRLSLRRLVTLLTACTVLLAASALAATQCVVCEKNLGERFFWVTSPVLTERQPVCLACAKLETACFVCRIPVKAHSFKLEDGRRFCDRHARSLILDQREADGIFTDAKREMFRLLRGSGEMPNLNVSMKLVDGKVMTGLAKQLGLGHDQFTTVGLTRTRKDGAECFHTVFLLNGQTRSGLLAAGAHEYAHAWMNENVPPDRKLDPDAVEGFCELMAYKVMSDLREETEKQIILKNAYTRGQIDTFVQAEDEHHFHRIVHWVKSGVGERIKSSRTTTGLDLKRQDQPRLPSWPQAVPTPVPDTLQLKGISGRPGRWLALINNETLRAGESARVRVAATNVLVRCLAITEQSAMIELVATGERRTLSLPPR
ncbi:MAG: hypothetical protein HZA90_27075 [Verrucomicrobia bacterium]|nr:hypothetical protein [Verrucomicrobiota bacterium]